MTLDINFKIPFMREFLLLHGVCNVSRDACLMVLGQGSGKAILIAPGGAQESLYTEPGTYDLVSGADVWWLCGALPQAGKLVLQPA